MRNAILALLVICSVVLGLSENAYSDRRGYVWTYEYLTMPRGMFEVEYYLTEQQKDINRSVPNTWKHQVELEYGLTDHWDISMYQRFTHSNTEDESTFGYDGFKLRTRYRFAEKNELPLDTLLYLEYIRDDDFKKPNVLEGKVIFARDIGKFNFAYDQILKQALESDGVTEHEYAAGVNYEITPRFKIGVETKGNYTDDKHYIGPTIAWRSNKFWISFGVVAGLNRRSNDLEARFILGVPLL
ncbi:MAG: hypothetical protein NG740_01410 [Omnitrophica bacterium]|nr:hypothetical protein [Candidatus Omnitrophota bacterium]